MLTAEKVDFVAGRSLRRRRQRDVAEDGVLDVLGIWIGC